MDVSRKRTAFIGITDKHLIDQNLIDLYGFADIIGSGLSLRLLDKFQREVDADIGFDENTLQLIEIGSIDSLIGIGEFLKTFSKANTGFIKTGNILVFGLFFFFFLSQNRSLLFCLTY